ncbi:hypothetical protein BJF78_28385 [Pseudonocardia sp. CNS-139]|nr:hypothetical protein BJF78_28385 [Pseudonocardia sp. CNS-139]
MLSARNLLRGYLLRMPTGQAVAATLGRTPLSSAELIAAAGPDQEAALTAGGFDTRTPLWFYVLAEAKALGNDGKRLGPVGSTIVAEVLVGLARRSADSIMRIPGWLPGLPSLHPGRFELADLLRYAGVLAGGPPATVYTVQAGDTLSGIAADRLGSAARWPEVFARNRAVLARPDRIFPGQRLYLRPARRSSRSCASTSSPPGETLAGSPATTSTARRGGRRSSPSTAASSPTPTSSWSAGAPAAAQVGTPGQGYRRPRGREAGGTCRVTNPADQPVRRTG